MSFNIDLFRVSDFSIYIDDLNNYNARHILQLLNSFNLLQHVTHSTHDVIDLVITVLRQIFVSIYFCSVHTFQITKLFALT